MSRGEDQIDMTHASKVKLQNSAGHSIAFTLEPWGDVYRIPDGKTAHVTGQSEQEGCFHVEMTDEGVLVWAWPQSEVSVAIGTEGGQSEGLGSMSLQPEAGSATRARLGVVTLLGRAMLAAGDRLLRIGGSGS